MSDFKNKLLIFIDTFFHDKEKNKFKNADFDFLAKSYQNNIKKYERLLITRNNALFNKKDIKLFNILPVAFLIKQNKHNDKIWDNLQLLYILSNANKEQVEQRKIEQQIEQQKIEQRKIEQQKIEQELKQKEQNKTSKQREQVIELNIDINNMVEKIHQMNYLEINVNIDFNYSIEDISRIILNTLWKHITKNTSNLSKSLFFKKYINDILQDNEIQMNSNYIIKIDFDNINMIHNEPEWFNNGILKYSGIIINANVCDIDIITLED